MYLHAASSHWIPCSLLPQEPNDEVARASSASSLEFMNCCEYPLVWNASPVLKPRRSSKSGPPHYKGPKRG